MPELRKRKHPRLKGYDYSSNGVYFITICTDNKRCILGEIKGCDAPDESSFQPSQCGIIVRKEIEETSSHYEGVAMEKYVVMPNHIHMIISVNRASSAMDERQNGAPGVSHPMVSIPGIIGVLKRKTNKAAGFPIWQTSYYDHVIRGDAEYLRIWEYIDQNPERWLVDKYYT